METIGAKIISRIQKLQRLAADQSGRPEGETAAELARTLMAEHGIAEIELQGDIKAEDPNVCITYEAAQNINWRFSLAAVVAQHCELRNTRTIGTKGIKFWGRRSGCEIAVFLYEVLARQIDSEWNVHIKAFRKTDEYQWMPMGRKDALKGDFSASAVSALSSRLAAMRADQAAKVPAGAMVLANRSKEAESFMKAELAASGHRLVSTHSKAPRYNSAGYAAGSRIPLQSGLSGSSSSPARLA